MIHTGDVTHLSKPEQFASAKDILSQLRAPLIVIPGEHDFIGKDYDSFFKAFPSMQRGKKWFSWDRTLFVVHPPAAKEIFLMDGSRAVARAAVATR